MSSSRTFAGRFIRLGRGGGGIKAVSEERLASAWEFDTDAMLAEVECSGNSYRNSYRVSRQLVVVDGG